MRLREEYKNNLLNYRYGVYLRYIKDLVKWSKTVVDFWCGNFIVASAIITWLGRWGVYIGVDKKEYDKDELLVFMRAANRLWVKNIVARHDSRYIPIKKCDVLVIDTLHNGNQLWAELYDAKNFVEKDIVILGTSEYGSDGETEEHLWLDAAIDKFLKENIDWEVSKKIEDSRYWLTTLSRITN